MYLTIPVTSTTSKRTFSAHRRLKNHLRSTMKEGCLDICLLMHCHKSVTDTLDTVKIACLNEEPHFKTFLRLCLCIHLFICLCCWYEMQCQRLFQLLFNKLTQSSNWMIRILLQYVLEKLTFSTQTQPLLCVRP